MVSVEMFVLSDRWLPLQCQGFALSGSPGRGARLCFRVAVHPVCERLILLNKSNQTASFPYLRHTNSQGFGVTRLAIAQSSQSRVRDVVPNQVRTGDSQRAGK